MKHNRGFEILIKYFEMKVSVKSNTFSSNQLNKSKQKFNFHLL